MLDKFLEWQKSNGLRNCTITDYRMDLTKTGDDQRPMLCSLACITHVINPPYICRPSTR